MCECTVWCVFEHSICSTLQPRHSSWRVDHWRTCRWYWRAWRYCWCAHYCAAQPNRAHRRVVFLSHGNLSWKIHYMSVVYIFPDNIICYIIITSQAISSHAIFVPGVWGPYYGAMVPSYHLTEGGQASLCNNKGKKSQTTERFICTNTRTHTQVYAIVCSPLLLLSLSFLTKKIQSRAQPESSWIMSSKLTEAFLPWASGPRLPTRRCTTISIPLQMRLRERQEWKMRSCSPKIITFFRSTMETARLWQIRLWRFEIN